MRDVSAFELEAAMDVETIGVLLVRFVFPGLLIWSANFLGLT